MKQSIAFGLSLQQYTVGSVPGHDIWHS